MTIRTVWMAGACVLAMCVAATAAPRARVAKCAAPAEVVAMQAAAIQQELMDAALTCGNIAQDNYNAFQIRFGTELRVSDKLMLRMFGRVMGVSRGDKAYNLYKTDLAGRSELRRTQNHDEFCGEANLMAAAALGPSQLQLADLASTFPVDISGGISGCPTQPAVATGVAKPAGVVGKPHARRGKRAPRSAPAH